MSQQQPDPALTAMIFEALSRTVADCGLCGRPDAQHPAMVIPSNRELQSLGIEPLPDSIVAWKCKVCCRCKELPDAYERLLRKLAAKRAARN